MKWDDPLPSSLVQDIINFFIELFNLEEIRFPRSLWPMEEVTGKPDLVVFTDGSTLAFGTVSYIGPSDLVVIGQV